VDIGTPKRIIEIEPVTLPVPGAPMPESEPETPVAPEPERAPEPAGPDQRRS
jgi:hypothetical protein